MENSMGTSERVQANTQHHDTMLTATILLIYTILYLAVAIPLRDETEREAQQLDLLSGS